MRFELTTFFGGDGILWSPGICNAHRLRSEFIRLVVVAINSPFDVTTVYTLTTSVLRLPVFLRACLMLTGQHEPYTRLRFCRLYVAWLCCPRRKVRWPRGVTRCLLSSNDEKSPWNEDKNQMIDDTLVGYQGRLLNSAVFLVYYRTMCWLPVIEEEGGEAYSFLFALVIWPSDDASLAIRSTWMGRGGLMFSNMDGNSHHPK